VRLIRIEGRQKKARKQTTHSGPSIHIAAADGGCSGGVKSSSDAARRNGRSIPSLFSRYISVVRFRPSLSAAPFGPPILQPVACSVQSISARSDSRIVICSGGSGFLDISPIEGGEGMGSADAGSGFKSTPSCARIMARATRFCSSRMFPGQEYDEKAAIVSGGM